MQFNINGGKSILIVSDTHIGGAFGSFPSNFKTSTGSILSLNRGQQYLLDCWKDILKRIPKKLDLLIINGDTVEGQNKFVMARNLSEVDPLWQVRAAEQWYMPLVKRAKETIMTVGSTYHSGKGGTYEELLAERLGARKKNNRSASAWWRFYFPGEDGHYFDVAHRQSYTIRYRSMPLERELDFLLNRFARKRMSPPKKIIIIRSHTHTGFRVWEENWATVISTPCMKIQDAYAQTSISPNRIIPDNLGVVELKINGDELRIIPHLYEHPEEADIDVIG